MEYAISKRVNIELQSTVANAAHDVKSPCTAISLAVESIEANMRVQQEIQHSPLTEENLSLVKTVMQILVYISMASNRVSVSTLSSGLGSYPVGMTVSRFLVFP